MIARGSVLEFETAERMLAAVRLLRERGLVRLDVLTPYQVPGVDEALALPRSPVARNVLVAGLLGAAFGYFVQYWTNAVDYPLIVGARPPHSAPAFVLITFENAVLFAALTAFFSVLKYSGLPRLWSPITEVEGIERASVDRFFVIVDAGDPKYDADLVSRSGADAGALRTTPFGEVA